MSTSHPRSRTAAKASSSATAPRVATARLESDEGEGASSSTYHGNGMRVSTKTTALSSTAKGKQRAIDPPLAGIDLSDYIVAGRLYAWADRPQHAAKCFATHIINAAPLPSEGFPQPVYILKQRPLLYADMVGMIVGVTEKEKRTIYLVDDGTAVLQVIESPPKLIAGRLHAVGSLVRVIGKIRHEWEERALHAYSIRPLSDRNQEMSHVHAVTLALQLTYQEPLSIDTLPTAPWDDILEDSIEGLDQRPTNIPPAYLPPVFTNANYYSAAHRLNPRGYDRTFDPFPGSTLPSPDATPKPTTKMKQAMLKTPPKAAKVPLLTSPWRSSDTDDSPMSSRSQSRRRLRAWYKLTNSELSASKFRPYVAEHIHTCCGPSAAPRASVSQQSSRSMKTTAGPGPVAFTVRYLRRQDGLRKHAERVVLHELEKRNAKAAKRAAGSSTSSMADTMHNRRGSGAEGTLKDAAKLSSEALATKVKRLFESIIRQLVDDGVIEIAPPDIPVEWPFNGRKVRLRDGDLLSAAAQKSRSRDVFGVLGSPTGAKRGTGALDPSFPTKPGGVPYLGSSDSESNDEAPSKQTGRSERAANRAHTTPRHVEYINVPSSSSSRALSRRRRSPIRKTVKRGTNADDDAISISSSSSASTSSTSSPIRSRVSRGKAIITVEDDSSSAGITSDTESEGDEGTSSAYEASTADEADSRAGSPTPRARRMAYSTARRDGSGPLLKKARMDDDAFARMSEATQRAADAWRGGGGGVRSTSMSSTGRGGGRSRAPRRPPQEAYRLVTTRQG